MRERRKKENKLSYWRGGTEGSYLSLEAVTADEVEALLASLGNALAVDARDGSLLNTGKRGAVGTGGGRGVAKGTEAAAAARLDLKVGSNALVRALVGGVDEAGVKTSGAVGVGLTLELLLSSKLTAAEVGEGRDSGAVTEDERGGGRALAPAAARRSVGALAGVAVELEELELGGGNGVLVTGALGQALRLLNDRGVVGVGVGDGKTAGLCAALEDKAGRSDLVDGTPREDVVPAARGVVGRVASKTVVGDVTPGEASALDAGLVVGVLVASAAGLKSRVSLQEMNVAMECHNENLYRILTTHCSALSREKMVYLTEPEVRMVGTRPQPMKVSALTTVERTDAAAATRRVSLTIFKRERMC
jgi:hypothetical protein